MPRLLSSADRELAGAWAVLVLATCLSWYLGDGHGPRTAGSLAVLAVAFAKVHLVGRHFLELRGAPPVLRRLFDGWCAGACTLLIVLYLIG
jgi:Prokaryotic Cytochrome C oxidase subunit IV